LTDYYFEKNSLDPIIIDKTKEITWDPKKYIKTIYAHERETVYQSEGNKDFECEKIDIEIPIIRNNDIATIASLKSSTSSLSYSEQDFSFLPEKIYFSLETK